MDFQTCVGVFFYPGPLIFHWFFRGKKNTPTLRNRKNLKIFYWFYYILICVVIIGTPVTNRVLHVIYKINIWNQKKSFSIQAFKIEMDVYMYICIYVYMFVQLTPPRRSILAICLISQCVGMDPTWVHWPKKFFFGMTKRRTKGSKY